MCFERCAVGCRARRFAENGSTALPSSDTVPTMTDFELVPAADVQLMQGLARRLTAARPDLVGAGASYGELAWV
jgi:hypothetical protein